MHPRVNYIFSQIHKITVKLAVNQRMIGFQYAAKRGNGQKGAIFSFTAVVALLILR